MRIAVIANTTWYLFNFRVPLIKALANLGHQVIAVGPDDGYIGRFDGLPVRHRVFPVVGASVNPLRELNSMIALRRVLCDEHVDVVFSFTPKANIYSLVVSPRTVAAFPNVSGLGRVFINKSLLTIVVKFLYRLSFKRARKIFFQNTDDLNLFVGLGLASLPQVERIPGSGVDTTRFVEATSSCVETGARGGFVFLLVARLLWDKGVGEYVEAARKVKAIFPDVEFHMLGFLDVQNPSAVSRNDVTEWEDEGLIRYLGSTDDVLPYLQIAQCVVLPSYREGCPRVLLEAAACAQPVITTDVPGCRDVVDDGITGYLCKVKDADDLATKMLDMLNLDQLARATMGRKGREKMLREFDESVVIKRYLDALKGLEES